VRGSSITLANILPMSGIVQRCTKNKEIGRYICVPVEAAGYRITKSGLVTARIRYRERPASRGCNDRDKGLAEKTREPIKGHVNQPS